MTERNESMVAVQRLNSDIAMLVATVSESVLSSKVGNRYTRNTHELCLEPIRTRV